MLFAQKGKIFTRYPKFCLFAGVSCCGSVSSTNFWARNEESSIGYVLDEVNKQIDQLTNYKFEVIIVVDHCDDNTESIAKEKLACVYHNSKRPGKGNALITGFSKSKGDIIIMLDADGSHDPSDFSKFINALEQGAGLVVGSRAKGGSDEYEIIRLFGNVLYTLLVDFLFGVSLTDSLNGYKAVRKEVVKKHRYRSPGFEIEIELLYSAVYNGYNIFEIPSHERKRMAGRMKSNTIIDGFRFLIAIIILGFRYRLLYKYGNRKRKDL